MRFAGNVDQNEENIKKDEPSADSLKSNISDMNNSCDFAGSSNYSQEEPVPYMNIFADGKDFNNNSHDQIIKNKQKK